jgi:hypothetical protein
VPQPTPAGPEGTEPADGTSILGEPELGPVTGNPSGPTLNAPSVRPVDGGTPRTAMQRSQTRLFDWDSLGVDAASNPAPSPSGVVPAGYTDDKVTR